MGNSRWLVLIAVSAFAQNPGEIKPAAVQGVVTNGITGEPVLRAHVTLRGTTPVAGGQPKNYGALTDAEGKFAITGMDPGGYGFAVEKPGFLMPVENAAGGRGTFLTLLPGGRKSDFTFKLLPAGAITGRVFDGAGEPAEGITISASGATANGGSITDEQGRFRIGGLAPGRYRLCAAPAAGMSLPPEVRTDGTKEQHYSPTCYPNVLTGKATPAVEVRAGAESSSMEIRLIETPMVRVSGRIYGAAPGHRVTVILGQQQSSHSGGSVKADGTYEIWGVDPGHYSVRATAYPFSGTGMIGADMQAMPRSAPVEVDVDAANVDHVDLTLMAPFDITGQVVYEDEGARPPVPQMPRGAAGAGAPRPAPMMMPRMISLMAMDGGMGVRPAQMKEDGTFVLQNVAPDRYTVNINWPNAYVKSTVLGPVTMDGAVLDVRSGAAGIPLTLQLSSGLAEISGKIQGEVAEIVGKIAVLAPQERSGVQPHFAQSPNGTFMFRVPPGKYLLFLIDQSERNGVFLARNSDYEAYAERAEELDPQAAGQDHQRPEVRTCLPGSASLTLKEGPVRLRPQRFIRILPLAVLAAALLVAQRRGERPAPTPGPMLTAGTMEFETPDFRLKLVRSSQTVAALEPKSAPGFDFTPADLLVERSQNGYYHLGDLDLRVRKGGAGPWTDYSTAQSRTAVTELAAAGGVLAAADLAPTLPAELPLKITRSWLLDRGALVLRFDLSNRASEPVQVGALGLPMVFNNVLTGRSLDQAHAVCSFSDPYIGMGAGYLQVTRLSGHGPALLVLPEGRTPFEAYNPIAQAPRGVALPRIFTDPTPRSNTFEGFFDWMVHSRAWAENEWKNASPWNPPTMLTLAPGESRTYGLRFVLSPGIRDIESALAAAGRPVAGR